MLEKLFPNNDSVAIDPKNVPSLKDAVGTWAGVIGLDNLSQLGTKGLYRLGTNSEDAILKLQGDALKKGWISKALNGGPEPWNGFFDPADKSILLGDKLKHHVGTVAHEIGHGIDYAKNPKLFGWGRRQLEPITKYTGGLLPGVTMLLGGSDNAVLGAGAAQSALSLPILRDEIAASANGYKLMRNMGHGKFSSLAAFAGLPSYMIAGLGVNFVPYAIKKIMRPDAQ